MSEIQQNRWDQLLRRVADLKGPGSKVNWALGDLLPILDVENVPAELQLLMGSKMCQGTRAQAAGGAGFFSSVQLANAIGSGTVLRLVAVAARLTSSGANVVMGPTQNVNANAGVEAFVDTRVFGEGTVGQVLGQQVSLVASSTFFRLRDDGTGIVYAPPGGIAVIAPGAAYEVGSETANVAINVSFQWIERVAQPSELNI